MKKIIVFNWKMNPQSLSEAKNIAGEAVRASEGKGNVETVICPPFIWFNELASKYPAAFFGSQDVFWENLGGAYTGEISASMLISSGAGYVIIGHSERRRYFNETDLMVNKKVLAALKAGLKVILCVGEDLEMRNRGLDEVKAFVKYQLEEDSKGISELADLPEQLIVAYEPIWAIGTGVPAKPEDAWEMIKFIREVLNSKFGIKNSRVLYGGSVNGDNIESFIKYEEVSGALVGGASLIPEEISKIIKVAADAE